MGFGNEKCKDIVENICPYCGETLIMNKRSFANHVRWCKKNPKYNEIRERTIKNISAHKQLRIKRTLTCPVCHNKFILEVTDNDFKKGNHRKTCSTECSHKLSVMNTHDTCEKNKQISLSLKNRYANHTENDRVKKCKHCGKTFIAKKSKNMYCSRGCARRDRDSNNLSLKKYYKSCCDFHFSLNSYPDEFDFTIIEQFGWYKAKNNGNNLYGVSRDHIFSCNDGFRKMIDPYIISHPANCQLLRHNDNASKHDKSNIMIDELISKIERWHKLYGIYPNNIDYKYFDENNIRLNYRFNW